MGFSDPTNKPYAKEQIVKLDPKKILDVGAGQGVYLDIIRQNLPEDVIVHAVEVWQPYIDQFNLNARYDKVFNQDVRTITDFDYDLVILGDILEHMTEAEALEVWNKVSNQAKHAIISMPIIHYHQEAINGNPYEVHVEEDWTTERILKAFGEIKEYKEFPVTGVFVATFENKMIPKTIWQTYKDPYEKLTDYMKDAMYSWKQYNPKYQVNYMDDAQAAQFILEEYGKEWYDLFINLPVGVMKGDLWRYMIIYSYGGIYADLDTICSRPVSSWIKNGYKMFVCPENDRDFCQWTFAASPKNPIIGSVLEYIKHKLTNPDYSKQHFVHNHTGPVAWSYGILNALNLEYGFNLIENFDLLNKSEKAKEYGLYLYGGEKWRIFHFDAVKHIYGSQKWNDGNYVQWIEDPLVKGAV